MEGILHKLHKKENQEGPDYAFWCPGCGEGHAVWVQPGRWEFNGNMEKPTFNPSLLIHRKMGEPPITAENFEEWKRNPWPQTKVDKICHLNVTDGQLIFHGDSTHHLSGKTVPMEPFPA